MLRVSATTHLLIASLNSPVATAAALWGVIMAVAPALQVYRMMRTKSSRDVSIGYFLLLLPGFLLWVLHGLLNRDLALAIPNAVSLASALILVAVATYYRLPRSSSTAVPPQRAQLTYGQNSVSSGAETEASPGPSAPDGPIRRALSSIKRAPPDSA